MRSPPPRSSKLAPARLHLTRSRSEPASAPTSAWGGRRERCVSGAERASASRGSARRSPPLDTTRDQVEAPCHCARLAASAGVERISLGATSTASNTETIAGQRAQSDASRLYGPQRPPPVRHQHASQHAQRDHLTTLAAVRSRRPPTRARRPADEVVDVTGCMPTSLRPQFDEYMSLAGAQQAGASPARTSDEADYACDHGTINRSCQSLAKIRADRASRRLASCCRGSAPRRHAGASRASLSRPEHPSTTKASMPPALALSTPRGAHARTRSTSRLPRRPWLRPPTAPIGYPASAIPASERRRFASMCARSAHRARRVPSRGRRKCNEPTRPSRP